MDRVEQEELIHGLLILGELFKSKPSKEMLKIYWMGLSSLSSAEWQAAVDAAVKRCTFFPKPAELRAFAAEKRREMEAEKRRLAEQKMGAALPATTAQNPIYPRLAMKAAENLRGRTWTTDEERTDAYRSEFMRLLKESLG